MKSSRDSSSRQPGHPPSSHQNFYQPQGAPSAPPPYSLHASPLQPNSMYPPTPMQPPYQAYMPPGAPQMPYGAGFQATEFDDGARFDVARQSIPPPPPGCIPTAAQMAASPGQAAPQPPQKKKNKFANFFTGGSGGGSVFW